MKIYLHRGTLPSRWLLQQHTAAAMMMAMVARLMEVATPMMVPGSTPSKLGSGIS